MMKLEQWQAVLKELQHAFKIYFLKHFILIMLHIT